MDAEKQTDIIVGRLRAENSRNAPRPPFAVGLLMLFGAIFAAAIIFY